MRGDAFHNDILVGRLRQVAEESGGTVATERPVPIDGAVSYADLVVEKNGQVTVCEAEQSPQRVGPDRRKAVALGAGLLLIATPDALTAQACRRKLRRLPRIETNLKVIICPLGAALEILRQSLTEGRSPAMPVAPHPVKQT